MLLGIESFRLLIPLLDSDMDRTQVEAQNSEVMDHCLPEQPDEWLAEIRLAIADAREKGPFGELIGQPITDANLFHLAPLVCMKYRGIDYRDEPLRKKVTEGALANYVVNSDPDGVDHGLEQRPLLAFALCYVSAHYVLDLIDEHEAEGILGYCEQHVD